ncbi:MAG: ABC transporter ATP-binding protein, partial [Rhodospirillales bacterium]|nr:ABC transporter ATP-binding protein [Rhodospirillales bacterium]
ILLLDEPSEGIQPTIVELIADVIASLNEKDALTVLLVEQNIDLVCATAHRCIVVDKGATAATLTPDELADPEVARQYLAI